MAAGAGATFSTRSLRPDVGEVCPLNSLAVSSPYRAGLPAESGLQGIRTHGSVWLGGESRRRPFTFHTTPTPTPCKVHTTLQPHPALSTRSSELVASDSS
ncbi:unnamed protein product [Boreogadus saida]